MAALATAEFPALRRDTTIFSGEHADYRESFRTFLAREAVPVRGEWAKGGDIPRALLRTAGEYGYLGMRVPEEFGGAGVDDARFGAVIGEEAMLAGVPALALVLVTHNDIALPAILGGPAAVAEPWLAKLASGETLATVVEGDVVFEDEGDAVRLTGTAKAVVAGAAANLFVVVATAADGSGRVVLALVERDEAAVAVERCEAPVGLDAAGLATVRLDGVRGPMLGEGAEPLMVSQAVALALTGLAGARAALAITTRYVIDRKAFGQPLAAFQNTRRMLASVIADIDVATAHVDRLLSGQLEGQVPLRAALAAKLFCTELYDRAVDAGVQLHGGYGYILEYEIAHAYIDARFWRLHEPNNEALKDTIADSLFSA